MIWKAEHMHSRKADQGRKLDAGTVCTIIGLRNQSDLNGLQCTVKISSERTEKVAVSVICDGKEKAILVKHENLKECMIQDATQHSVLKALDKDAAKAQIVSNTIDDVKEFKAKNQKLVARLEEAIACRNSKQFSRAETLFTKRLSEAEELCGRNSVHVATFAKSFGILRAQQERWSEAEDFLARADRLRPADCEENQQGTHTLTSIFTTQLNGRQFNKAVDTLRRIRGLKHCIRPGVDSAIHELEKELEIAKANPPRCARCRNPLVKVLACARCHVTAYCSRSCQKAHWKYHKPACTKPAVVRDSSINGNNKLLAQTLPTQGASSTQTASGDADLLTAAVFHNAEATKSVSPSSPTELSTPLLGALADPLQSYFFGMNEVTSSSLLEADGGRRRFLATAGVLTCITVFVWSPPTGTASLGRCFGAHVSLPALLRGLRACQITKQDIDRALAPLVSQLCCCFEESVQNVTVTLVGGHRAMDTIDALVGMFPRDSEKWSFAWHVKAACEVALDHVLDAVTWNTHLLMRFEGEQIKDYATEERVRRKNMNFMVAALDTATGCLITHTRYTDIDTLLTADVLFRQRKLYGLALGDTFSDPKLSQVSHKDEGC
jgi:hypothetical protein